MKLRLFTLTCLLSATAIFATTSAAQTVATDHPQNTLVPGKAVVRSLKGSETHHYIVELQANDLANIVVDQRGIDVVVTVLTPDGKKLREVDSPNGTMGPELLQFVPKTSGKHLVEVRPIVTAVAGTYEIRIHTPRPATPEERKQNRIKDVASLLIFAN